MFHFSLRWRKKNEPVVYDWQSLSAWTAEVNARLTRLEKTAEEVKMRQSELAGADDAFTFSIAKLEARSEVMRKFFDRQSEINKLFLDHYAALTTAVKRKAPQS